MTTEDRPVHRLRLILIGRLIATAPTKEETTMTRPWMTRALVWLLALLASTGAWAQPTVKEGDYIARDFRFTSGETLAELKLHYTTLGDPSGEPVLLLHGTTGSGASLRGPAFGGELFGPGQALDTSRYYIILPDAIGHGKSSKPSDGLRTAFPKYNYADMVRATHMLLTEHLKVRHLRLALGYSMGGMQTWLFAQTYPGFADVAVPMASLPVPMGGRNWMMRRLIIDAIRNDPEWKNGQYASQPPSAKFASVFFGLATFGGDQGLYKLAPTREKADAVVDARLAAPFIADANDTLYQWASSGDYDPSAGLEKIQGVLLVINSADDERNPPALGVLDREIKRVKGARVLMIPGSETTSGHGTPGQAKWWKDELAALLGSAPRLTP